MTRNALIDPAAFISANLPLASVPGLPEIRLHRAGPSSGLRRLGERDPQGFGSPYWAYPWAGGLALARHILDRPQTVAGRCVLDLGAGSGVVGIAAALSGAREVVASDIDPYARAVLALNAAANGVSFAAILGDLTTDAALPTTDLVVVGDLFYAPALAGTVLAFLDRYLAAGAEVLVGDLGRAFLPRARLRQIAEYPVADFGDPAAALRSSAVFSLVAAAA